MPAEARSQAHPSDAAAAPPPAPFATASTSGMHGETPEQQLERLKQELIQIKRAEAEVDRDNERMRQERDQMRRSAAAAPFSCACSSA